MSTKKVDVAAHSITLTRARDLVRELVLEGSGEGLKLLILGPPGLGKSAAMRQAAAAYAKVIGLPLHDSVDGPPTAQAFGICETIWSQFDPSDLRFPALDAASGDYTFRYSSELPLVGNESRFPTRGVWVHDEVTNVEPFLQKILMQVILEGRIGARRVLPGWRQVAAGNRMADSMLVAPLAVPLANRFVHATVVADIDAWIDWAFESGVDPLVIAFLKNRPNLLHAFNSSHHAAGQYASPTPRSWECVSRQCLPLSEPSKSDAIIGSVGIGPATEFLSWAKVKDEMPDLERIRNGKGSKTERIPSRPDALVATAIALVHISDDNSLPHVVEYVLRMPREFQKLWSVDLPRKAKRLLLHPAFRTWVTAHAVGGSK